MRKLKRARERKKKSLYRLTKVSTTTILVGGLLFGTYLTFTQTAQAASAPLESAPIDLNIIPEDRLAEALKEQGVISKNASAAQVKKAVKEYINNKQGTKPAGEGEYHSDHHHSEEQKEKLDKKAKDFLTKQKDKLAKQLNKGHENYKKGKPN